MSEYQYYWFEAIDKPLTPEQQKELRAISTRAQVNSKRFENEYHFGDLKAEPIKLVKKYFDAHCYYANWGTRILMLKVPAKSVDLPLVQQYANDETLDIVKNGSNVIFDFTADIDYNEEWWEIESEIKKFISLRDSIIAGDYRCLYIAWLAAQYDDEDDDIGKKCRRKKPKMTPPIPPGMKNLTGQLRSFVDFMYLSESTLEKAIQNASAEEPLTPTLKEIKAWIADLSDKDREKVLVDLIQGKELPQTVQRELLQRFLDDRRKLNQAKSKVTTAKPTKKSCRKKL